MLIVHVPKPDDRPHVKVPVDGVWCPGELRMWTQTDDGTSVGRVQYRPPGTHTRPSHVPGRADPRGHRGQVGGLQRVAGTTDLATAGATVAQEVGVVPQMCLGDSGKALLRPTGHPGRQVRGPSLTVTSPGQIAVLADGDFAIRDPASTSN